MRCLIGDTGRRWCLTSVITRCAILLQTCEDVDECGDESACGDERGAICSNYAGGFNCSCLNGFYLENNKCRGAKSSNASTSIMHVVNHSIRIRHFASVDAVETGARSGTAMRLLTRVRILLRISDKDECVTSPGVCGNETLCVNTPGAFQCVCPTGYELTDDRTCQSTFCCRASLMHVTCGLPTGKRHLGR